MGAIARGAPRSRYCDWRRLPFEVDRERRRPRWFGPHRVGASLSRAAAGTALLAAALLMLTSPPAAGAAATVTAASLTSGGTPALSLVSQSSWVTNGAGATFDLRLHVATEGRDPTHLGLAVSVYPCLSSVSGFDQSVAAGGLGNPSSSTRQPIPLTSLPSAAGVVDLSMPVVVDGSAVAGAPFTVDLVPTAGQCQAFPSGVFPVRVQEVDDSSGAVIGSLVTHLVFTETSATEKLHVAFVLPVQLPLTASAASSSELAVRPSAALAPPSTASVAGLAGSVAAAGRHPSVPLTLSLSGQALQTLSATGHDSSIDQLSTLSLDTPDHQVLYAPYVPVDATAFVSANLGTELSLQVARGAQVSAPVTHQTPAPDTASGLGTWVATSGLDADTVATLQGDGFRQVVVPSSAVVQAPTNGSTSVPFTVTGSHNSQLSAVAADSDLTARFDGAGGDAVLAAHQLLAELAQIYFEKPNAEAARGVVVMPPSAWQARPAFVDALLGALDNSPVLAPVTVNGLLGAVPASTSCHLDCRLTGTPAGPPLPAAAVRNGRLRVNAFASSVPAGPARPVVNQLSDLVLAGESSLLRPVEQASVLAAAGRALAAQTQRLVVGGGQVTLTSQQGTLPVTITSSAPYVVQVTVTLNSDKLVFPNGATQWTRPGVVTLLPSPHTTVIDVPVRTRGSGVFPVEVVVRTPTGGLQLAAGTIDIRSTAASVVGIVLSVGAVAVLAAWWFRTSRRRRAARRREEANEPHPPVPVGVP